MSALANTTQALAVALAGGFLLYFVFTLVGVERRIERRLKSQKRIHPSG